MSDSMFVRTVPVGNKAALQKLIARKLRSTERDGTPVPEVFDAAPLRQWLLSGGNGRMVPQEVYDANMAYVRRNADAIRKQYGWYPKTGDLGVYDPDFGRER